MIGNGVALDHGQLRVEIAHVDQNRLAVALVKGEQQQRGAERRRHVGLDLDIEIGQQRARILDELRVRLNEGNQRRQRLAL